MSQIDSAKIINSLESILISCEERHRPVQEEPARSEIFDLFAATIQAGGESPALGAEEICRELAARWGLRGALQSSLEQQTGLAPAQLAKMRSLWSLIQMWMEWSYAWERWPEFHPVSGTT